MILLRYYGLGNTQEEYQIIDYLHITIVDSGGITPLQKIAHLAEVYNVCAGFHGATDLSP